MAHERSFHPGLLSARHPPLVAGPSPAGGPAPGHAHDSLVLDLPLVRPAWAAASLPSHVHASLQGRLAPARRVVLFEPHMAFPEYLLSLRAVPPDRTQAFLSQQLAAELSSRAQRWLRSICAAPLAGPSGGLPARVQSLARGLGVALWASKELPSTSKAGKSSTPPSAYKCLNVARKTLQHVSLGAASPLSPLPTAALDGKLAGGSHLMTPTDNTYNPNNHRDRPF